MKTKHLIVLLACITIFSVLYSAIIDVNNILDYSNNDDINNFTTYLNNSIPKLMKKYRVPGVAIAIIEDGEAAFIGGFGFSDKEEKDPIDGDTVFQAASISKSLAAWGILKLVEENKIKLEDPVEMHLNRWHIPESEYKDKVTIKNILNHTSGLSVRGYAGYTPTKKLPTLEDSLSGEVKGYEEVHILFEPGTQYKYSGGGYTVLQLLVEEVKEIPFSKYMSSNILRPLDMNNSSFQLNRAIEDKMATPYGVVGQRLPVYLYTEEAAAGLYTTAEDLVKFILSSMELEIGAISNKKKIISSETLQLMQQKSNTNSSFGLGYMIENLSNGEKLVGHRGTNRGWRNNYFFNPMSRDGMIILTNSELGRNLVLDIEIIWRKWKATDLSDGIKKELVKRKLVKMIALFLGLSLSILIIDILISIVKKKRTFAFCLSNKKCFFRYLSFMILPITIFIIWLLVLYTGLFYDGWILATFVPWGIDIITVELAFWCIYSMILGLFPIATNIENNNRTLNTGI